MASDRAALDKAVGKKLFARGFKAPVAVPQNWLTKLSENKLSRRVVELLSLARKSGDAVAGYEKVKIVAGPGRGAGADSGQQMDRGAASRNSARRTYGKYIGWLTADELGQAFGRQTVIHAAFASGGLAKRVVEEAQRLRGLRETDDGGKGPRGRVKSFMSDSDGKKTLGLRGGARPGNVKQSFSHGRTKNVVVETKRKRVVVPKPGAAKPAGWCRYSADG